MSTPTASQTQSERVQRALLLQMTELTNKLDTTSRVVNNLNKTVVNLDAKDDSKPIPMANSLQVLTHRGLGYVNWQNGHTQKGLQNQRLVKVSDIRAAVALLLGGGKTNSESSTFNQGKNVLSSMSENQPNKNTNNMYNSGFGGHVYNSGFGGHVYNSGFGGNTNHQSSTTTTVNVKTVDKETRFPPDAVYVDTNLPHVKTEIDFLRQVNIRPTDGVIERFMSIIEKEMHTTRSFEEKYGLKWQ